MGVAKTRLPNKEGARVEKADPRIHQCSGVSHLARLGDQPTSQPAYQPNNQPANQPTERCLRRCAALVRACVRADVIFFSTISYSRHAVTGTEHESTMWPPCFCLSNSLRQSQLSVQKVRRNGATRTRTNTHLTLPLAPAPKGHSRRGSQPGSTRKELTVSLHQSRDCFTRRAWMPVMCTPSRFDIDHWSPTA